MHVQFVTNEEGKKTAVQLSIKQWNDVQKNLQKLKLLEDLKSSFKEMEEHVKGKIKTPTTKQLFAQL